MSTVLLSSVVAAQTSPFQNYKQLVRPKELPDFEFYTQNNQSVRLSDFKGNVVLLNLWATWCTPCLKEMPDLNKIAKEFEPLGLKVIPLNSDPRDSEIKITRYLAKLGVDKLGVYRDKKAAVTLHQDVQKFPYTMVINRDMQLIGIIEGFTNWDSKDARFVLKSELEYGLADYIDQTYNPAHLRPNFKKSPTQQQQPYAQPKLWQNPDAFGVFKK